MTSTIIASAELEFAKKSILERIDSKLIKTFFVDEFKVDDAKEVVKEAYIAEEKQKYLILAALKYNTYAQNALLKLLEEPPRNITFILIAKSKTSLLPTIRSRMRVEYLESHKEPYALDLNLAKMGLNEIFLFLKKHKNSSKDELKEIIQTILKELMFTYRMNLTATELDMFDKMMELAEFHARPQSILSYMLLTIHQAQGRPQV
ncbi:MAG: DNA polymerase III subunit delta' [Epsilonproteobacteria bacterium]|nr:DNA polymerase III subunit delta' [Campylobacterota bacterium]